MFPAAKTAMPWRDFFTKARTRLLMSNAFFAQIALQLNVIEDTTIDTLATDGKSILVNPHFLTSLSTEHAQFAVAHEVLHVVLEHHLRLQNRDHDTWNIACDYVINGELAQAGFSVPDFVYHDKKFYGQSAEQVYSAIYKPQTQQSQPQQGQQGTQSKGRKVRIGDVVTPKGANGQTPTPADIASAQADVKTMVAQAIAGMEAGKSQLPPSIRDLIRSNTRSNRDWQTALRDFIDSAIYTETSFTTPHTTQLALDPDAPWPGPKAFGMSHLVIVVDTSGSIDTKTLGKFEAEINDIRSQKHIERTTIIDADDRVNNVTTIDGTTDPVTLTSKGGGGTDFRPAFDHINQQLNDVTLVIYLTDMYTVHFGTPPNCKTLWAVYGSRQHFPQLANRAPFGESIYIGPEE